MRICGIENHFETLRGHLSPRNVLSLKHALMSTDQTQAPVAAELVENVRKAQTDR